jgi:hypothetical protein
MNRIVGIVLLCVTNLVLVQTGHAEQKANIDQEHTHWIDNALRSMQRIKVGNKYLPQRAGFQTLRSGHMFIATVLTSRSTSDLHPPLTKNFPQTELLTFRGLTLTGQLRID